MRDYQREFLEFAICTGVMQFGEFVLKSGRKSPYFFNAGLFSTGKSLARLGEFYADRLLDWGQSFDVLYGPAYKGIPLAASTAMALADKTGREIPFCFNRKEIKDHGEGGIIVGAELKGKIVIVDDVITAGISVDESVRIIQAGGAEPLAVCIALDRLERGLHGEEPATVTVEQRHNIPVLSIANLDILVDFLNHSVEHRNFVADIERYQKQYGASLCPSMTQRKGSK